MIKIVNNHIDSEEPDYIIPADNSQRVLEWRAVLESQDINYDLQKSPHNDSWIFFFSSEDFAIAKKNIDAYESERPFFRKFRELFTSSPAPLRMKIIFPCLFLSLIFSFFYWVTGASAVNSIWHRKGMLSSDFFSSLKWWTPVTALTLHSDFIHLAGNLLFFIIFGTAVVIQAGVGTMLFFVVLSGVLGNLTTLFIFRHNVYSAIGFSTSVFALLGILATLRLMKKMKSEKISSFYFWIPLLSAVAILGLTGGAAGSDLAGHLFGFIWGCVTGVAVSFMAKWKKKRCLQASLSVLTFLIIALCWYVAVPK